MSATKGHGTPSGFKAGCKSRGGCPNRDITCVDADIRYRADYAFQKGIDAGIPLELLLEGDAPAKPSSPVKSSRSDLRARRNAPKPTPPPTPAPQPAASDDDPLRAELSLQLEQTRLISQEIPPIPTYTYPTIEEVRASYQLAPTVTSLAASSPAMGGLLEHFGIDPWRGRPAPDAPVIIERIESPALAEVVPLELPADDPFDGRHLLGCPAGEGCTCPPVAGLLEALSSAPQLPGRDCAVITTATRLQLAEALEQLTRLVLLRENAYSQLLAQNGELLRKARK